MVWFSEEQSAAAVMIHQLITGWAHELDRNEGVTLAPFIADDCVYMARGVPRHGPEGVLRFYRERLAELNQQPAGPPTLRHVISNLLINFTGSDNASVDFLLTFYSSPKKPPVTDFQGPTAVADCHMDCSRGTDGRWRIASFDSVQNFVATAAG